MSVGAELTPEVCVFRYAIFRPGGGDDEYVEHRDHVGLLRLVVSTLLDLGPLGADRDLIREGLEQGWIPDALRPPDQRLYELAEPIAFWGQLAAAACGDGWGFTPMHDARDRHGPREGPRGEEP